LELVLRLTPTPVGGAYVPKEHLKEVQPVYPLDLYLCHGCGYAGILDVVSQEVLWDDSIEVTSMSMGVVKDLGEQAEAMVARKAPPKGSLAVDIGSNDGSLLKFFKQHGLRVLGVEPARYVADIATAAGIPTLQNYFSRDLAKTIKAEWGPAKFVSANRVFANIDNLTDVLQGIRHLLDSDGIFVFETGYLLDILRDELFETIYHEHLGYDSVKPLQAFFHRNDMELIDVEHIPLKGGSLRGTVQLAGGPEPVSESVASLISREESLGLDTAGPFAAFSAKLDSAKKQLTKLVGGLKASGKDIIGYGAAVPSTTLIYHFDLGDSLSLLVDDDPKYHNLFSPGFHIPVSSPQAIYERNPDYVLIVAWRYAEPIMKKHQAYIDQGGHFILPMPNVQVI
jgi:hypothetical protein